MPIARRGGSACFYVARTGGFDKLLLETENGICAHLELEDHREASWHSPIMQSLAAWRDLNAAQGGTLEVDHTTRTPPYVPTAPVASATAAAL